MPVIVVWNIAKHTRPHGLTLSCKD